MYNNLELHEIILENAIYLEPANTMICMQGLRPECYETLVTPLLVERGVSQSRGRVGS